MAKGRRRRGAVTVQRMTKASKLGELAAVVVAEREAASVTDLVAREALQCGASYREVGELLGMTRQAVHARYGPVN